MIHAPGITSPLSTKNAAQYFTSAHDNLRLDNIDTQLLGIQA